MTASMQMDHRVGIASAAAVDVATATLTFGASLALLSHGGFPPSHAHAVPQVDAISATLAAFATLSLVMWRRAPFAVFALTASASALSAGLGYAFGAPLGPAAALYLLAASRDEASSWTWRTTASAATLFAAYVITTTAAHDAVPESDILHVGLAWGVAWFAGERTRLRREHIADLKQRAARNEQDARRDRELATAEERARVARDLHDSAGHAISVIAVRAGAARLRHDEHPERSRLALEEIEQLARQTVAEIDAIVGALREGRPGAGDIVAPPGLASINALIERQATAGLAVTFVTHGTPRSLDGPVDQAAYRILQEALTNAARHGTGSAQIDVSYTDGGLWISVDNPVAPDARASGRTGHGLIGMQERAALLEGRLQAQRVNGSFHLRAELPYQGSRT